MRALTLSRPCVFLVLCVAAFQSAAQSPALPPAYGNLPLTFEANQGQTDPSVQALAHGEGYMLFLRPNEAVLELSQPGAPAKAPSTTIRLKLADANPSATVSPESPQITRTNYFLGKDPGKWHTNVPNYGRIHYQSIYPGIDLVYYGNQYGNQRHLEHDFIVAPNADPTVIQLTIEGTRKPHIDKNTGELILQTPTGVVRLLKPITYQQQNGARRRISSSYKLLTDNRIGFSLGAYNHSLPLVIDPILVYSTYLGGSGAADYEGDQGNGIAVDSSGEAYIVGTTFSTNFPISAGSFQTQDNAATGDATVFISKLNPGGTALVYSTFLGGSGGDYGYGIALDAGNNAYVTGATYSIDFPVTCTAFLPANPSKTSGAPTGFVAELTANGDALAYSTYLGGSGNQSSPAAGDVSQAIALDSAGNAYVTGYTYSPDFPVTDSAFQPNFAGSASSGNAFVAKLNPGGTSLAFATYLGGSGGDYGNGIAVDGSGNAYIAGTTASGNFPVTATAFQSTLLGPTNAFVVELNPTATAEVYSTYLGGTGQQAAEGDFFPPAAIGDTASAIALDSNGSAYVAGTTTSSDFPVTAGVLEGASDFDGSTGFVTKFNKGGSTLAYSTYLEGVGTSISGLAVDSSGTAYITGSIPAVSAGEPGGFQTTSNALPTPTSTANSAFIAKLNASATELNYASVLGGSSNDGATAIALDAAGDVFVTGNATSADFPVTAGAFQTSNKAAASGGNAFISRLALASETGNTSFPAFPTGIATTLAADGPGQITLLYCGGPDDTSANSFGFGVNVSLTPAASGPPPTGFVIFTDSFNYNFPNPYQLQFTGTWGSGPSVFTLSDGESMDGPIGPFSVSWTASYYGDRVYATSSTSGTVSSPGCPSSSSSVGIAGPKILGPHIELLSPSMLGKRASASIPGNASSAPAATEATASSTSGIIAIHGAKFVPALPSAHPDELSRDSAAASSSQPSAACLATPQAATPTLSLSAGSYTSNQTLTIADTTSGASIYYTSNGSTPTTSSTLYSGAISISSTETINAIAAAAGYTNSAVASAVYTITRPAVAPVFSPQSGTYTSAQTVTITDTTPGASIYYTTDGSTPATSSTLYSGSITVSSTETVSAIAAAAGYTNSAVASAAYTITPPAVAPTFSPQSGTYTSAQTVTITDTTPGASIYYTTDGSTPATSSTLYSGSITVSSTETINAIATASGYISSPVASATYTITPPPTFTVSASASSLTIAPGQSGTVVISVAPQYGFTGATTFSCSGLPAGVTCSFSPASITPSGAAASTTLTVAASSSASLPGSNERPGPHGPGFATPILALSFAVFGWRRRRFLSQLLLFAAVTSALTLFFACGGSSAPKPVTSAVSVIATSGTIQQTIKLTITIQ